MLIPGASLPMAQQVSVRQAEGLVHGFLVLRTLDGAPLADGDLSQTSRGSRVTSRLVFRFRDGSVHDETTVFSQTQSFRLLSDHLVQKGPAFPAPLDMLIEADKGLVTMRHTDDHGKEVVDVTHLELPLNTANGLLPILLKAIRPGGPIPVLSLVAATPKPRVVKLAIAAVGEETFTTGVTAWKSTDYVVKVEIGGLAGVVAPLVGKQPPDSHVWILTGDAPAFVRSEQPLYVGGPIWRIELASPSWPAGK
jgi:hypothetical protein